MAEWLPLYKEIGALAIIALIVFKGWPFLVKQLENAQAERRELSAEFLKALERRDSAFGEVVNKLKDLESAISRRLDR